MEATTNVECEAGGTNTRQTEYSKRCDQQPSKVEGIVFVLGRLSDDPDLDPSVHDRIRTQHPMSAARSRTGPVLEWYGMRRRSGQPPSLRIICGVAST